MKPEDEDRVSRMPHACEMMRMMVADPRFELDYIPRNRTYVLTHRYDGAASLLQQIWFCPWCGDKLPDSLDDQWFAAMDLIVPGGYDISYPLEKLPAEYQTDKWWRDRHL